MKVVRRPWPSEDLIRDLVDKSGGYFIYASTIIKFIDEEYFSPKDRLDLVLNGSNSAVPPSELAPFAELDKLYLQILSSCPTSKLPVFKCILGYIEFAATPAEAEGWERRTVAEIEALLDLPCGQVKLLLRGMRSLVSFEERGDGGFVDVQLNHASFIDFLHDKDRSGDYHVDFEAWLYKAFCNALSIGCKILGLSKTAGVSASHHPKGLSVIMTSSCE